MRSADWQNLRVAIQNNIYSIAEENVTVHLQSPLPQEFNH